MSKPILIISGTNRPGSNTAKVAKAVLHHYQQAGEAAELYDLTTLPPEIFHADSYAKKPAAFVAVQQQVVEAAGLHLVTPEYNGSFSGVLKYFIDMLKFPESFETKPVAFVGVANGVWGALRAVEQLQMIFSYRNAHIFPERVFIPQVGTKLNPEGLLADAALDGRLASQASNFARFSRSIAACRTA